MDTTTESASIPRSEDWWSTPWAEAKAARGEEVTLPDGSVLSAKSIKKTGADLDSMRVKAKGDVIVQTPGSNPIRARAYQATYRDGVISMEGKPVAVQSTTRLVAVDGMTLITITDGKLAVEGPSRLESVDQGPPALATRKIEIQEEAPKPKPISESKPKPAPSVSKPTPPKIDEPAKPAAPKPAPSEPAKTESEKPAAKPAPKPVVPQMRLPDEIDLPDLQPGPKP